jgi:Arc/MetJ family transcription regulator
MPTHHGVTTLHHDIVPWRHRYQEVGMARTVIDLDEEAYGEAAALLGTGSKVATVNEALRRVAAQARAREANQQLQELIGDNPELMSQFDDLTAKARAPHAA